MKFTLLSVTEKEIKNNSLYLDESLDIDENLIKSAVKKVYVLETENGAKILLSKDILTLENQSIEINKDISGAVSKVMPKISYKDFNIIEKVKSGVEGLTKLLSNQNYEKAFSYLDYLENDRAKTKVAELDIAKNDKEIFFSVLNNIDETFVGKDIYLEVNEAQTISLISSLDEEQLLVTAANSKNRISNNLERSKFNIKNIVKDLSNQYKEDFENKKSISLDCDGDVVIHPNEKGFENKKSIHLDYEGEVVITNSAVSKKIASLRKNNPKVPLNIISKMVKK